MVRSREQVRYLTIDSVQDLLRLGIHSVEICPLKGFASDFVLDRGAILLRPEIIIHILECFLHVTKKHHSVIVSLPGAEEAAFRFACLLLILEAVAPHSAR
jgi:hypothetical protein